MDEMNTIGRNSFVLFEYVLRNADGELIEASSVDDPPTYIHGFRQLIGGLERQLEGHRVGDRFQIVVDPGEAYGERNENLSVAVSRTEVPEDVPLYEGASFDAVNERGDMIKLYVASADEDQVVLDANHPLAGVELHYDITVKRVRPATEEELMEAASPVYGIDLDERKLKIKP